MNRFYANGGIVGGMDEEMLPPVEEGAGLPVEQLQSIPPEELQAIVIGAKEALEGTHPDPMNALEDFIEVFGEQELESLKDAVIQEMEGGAPVMEGDPSLMSDGLSDSIPTSIDGVEPAALSEGEYVIPADAVSGLGNGDTGSGARRLEDMVGKIRSARGSAPVPPPAMNPASVMPLEVGGYSSDGPVEAFGYAEGGVVPSLSSGLFGLSEGRPPVNVMDPYPGGSFEVPELVPPSNDFTLTPSLNPEEELREWEQYEYDKRQARAATARARSQDRYEENLVRRADRKALTLAEKEARQAARLAEREARQAARLARPQARRDLRDERRLERQARPVARREQRREEAQARFDLRQQRSLDRINSRRERQRARAQE